jgi:hypothetical protein
MKYFFTAVTLASLLLLGGAASAYAQNATNPGNTGAACSATNVNSDSCYVQNCTGQSGQDSASCNAYASYVVNRDDGGDTTCLSIGDGTNGTVNNEQQCCYGDNESNQSPMCQAFESDNGTGAGGVEADTPGTTGSQSQSGSASTTGSANIVPINIALKNPLNNGVSTIPDAVNKILSVVIRIALPLIILMFIWSGITFIFARGNPTKIGTAKNMFLYTCIGTLLILGAWTITNALIGTVDTVIK